MPIVTLTTDFGCRDWFVGTMKGVILGINPAATVVDVTHDVTAGDIRAGAFALAASYRFFPKGTVHVAVVDPGVGGGRKAIAVRTASYLFVGPDNGVLSWALAKQQILAVHLLEKAAYFLAPVSCTFHGRDLFAPAAAHLSRGVPIEKLGRAWKRLVRLDWPEPRFYKDKVEGQVVYVDRFGNAITNIDAPALESLGDVPLAVFDRRRRVCGVDKYYQAVRPGSAVAVLGSSGFLEIAINGGDAAAQLEYSLGAPVAVCRDQRRPKSPG